MSENSKHLKADGLVIKPTSDVFIAAFLSAPKNNRILLDIINAVLEDAGQVLARTATVLNPFNVREFVEKKQIVLDVRVVDEAGRMFNIEIQTTLHAAFSERLLFGGADSIAAQLHAGKQFTGLTPVICIVITEFNFMDPVDGAHLIFELRERHHPEVILTHHFQIHVLRLHALLQGRWEILDTVSAQRLRLWLIFLVLGGKLEEHKMSHVVDNDPLVMEAVEDFRRFSSNPAMREMERRHNLWKLEYYSGIEAARKEGKAEGRAEGKAEGRAEGKAEGRAEGKAEGEAKGKAESVLSILNARFGSVSKPVRSAVMVCADLKKLNALIHLAAICGSIDEFAKELLRAE